MKFKNIATRTGLYSTIALMFTACQSDEQKLLEINNEIENTEEEIEQTYNHNQATDSIARNPMIKALNTVIDAQTPRMNKLFERNWELSDSIKSIKIQRIARKYPLRKFLSRNVLKVIQEQLRQGYCQHSEQSVQNIIAGRGTLLDLYAVSFDLQLEPCEPFCIIDPFGTVRFYDIKRDALRQKFDDERWNVLTEQTQNKEIQANQKEMEDFDRMRAVRDSVCTVIEFHFEPQIRQRIDSLEQELNNKRRQKEELIQKMRSR